MGILKGLFKGSGILILMAGVILLASSWFVNIYKLIELDFEAPYKAEIIRVIGIPVVPVGMIAAYMDIGEENK